MIKQCKYCKNTIQFSKHQQFGWHIINCSDNPNLKVIIQKRAESKTLPKKEYRLVCPKCNDIFIVVITENDFKKKKHKKFCSRKCSNSHHKTQATKDKISRKMLAITKLYIKERNNCLVCGEKVKKIQNIYCSKKCMHSCPKYRKKTSEIATDRYLKNPEMHPNRRCAGIRESYPERMVREFLEQKGLVKNCDFIQQFPVNNYHVDFYFQT